MSKKMAVAVIGCGAFAQEFVPLFQSHPTVEKVYVCDLDAAKANAYSEMFQVPVIESFEKAIVTPEITAVAIFTQRHTHGDLASRALLAGKDVYSAVPMALSVEDCKKIIDAVRLSGKTYMMGETCVYYPCAMYCRERHQKGDFGHFVYGESQYFHDLSHFPKDFVADRVASAVPPFFYPTHSTAMILHAADTYATKVTAMGYVDREENTPFAVGENHWDNVFSNEFSLMQLANGGIARVSECRRIGYRAPSSYISGFYGTKASYQFNNAQHLVTTLTEKGVDLEDVSDQVNPYPMAEHKDESNFKHRVANYAYQNTDQSPPQQARYDRLPDAFKAMSKRNCHMGTHHFLIDDFCSAVETGKLPYVNAWRAARYTIPGLMAHESAKLGGVPMDIPDFGEAPEHA